MRILFVVTRADTIGGAQIHVRDLATRLMKDGADVLVCTGPGVTYSKVLQDSHIPFIQLPQLHRDVNVLKDIASTRALIKAIRSFCPDIVSTHSAKAGVVGRIAARMVGTPCIYTAHGWVFGNRAPEPRNSVYKYLEKALAPLSTKIVCVSEQVRGAGVEIGIDSDRLVTIHNGMPNVCTTIKAHGLGSPPKIVMIGRFQEPKHQKALVLTVANVEGCTLEFVGDGPDEQSVQKAAKELSIEERVTFLGFQEDVSGILQQADIFALVSHQEGFPRSILEAMRAGLPVVATDVGGVREAVVDGVNGYVVPVGDQAMLNDRVRTLVEDSELRRRMGHASRNRYETHFTFERMYSETVAMYREVLHSIEGEKGEMSVSSSR